MFFIAHLIIRRYFDKQYHCGTTALCIITTLSIAFFGIASILPVTASLLSTIPICCFISWVGYVAQDRIDLLAYKHGKEQFDLTTCTEAQLVEVCKLLHYKSNKITLAIMFFVENKTIDEVYQYLNDTQQNVERETVIQYKYRIKKDIENLISK